MPSIDDGGVEKNFFLISNYLSKKLSKVAVITISKKYQKNLDNNIELITTKSKWHDKIGRRKKFFIALFLLFLETISNKKVTVLCFQANIYCTILCKLLSIKIIIRSNTSSTGWSQNRFKRFSGGILSITCLSTTGRGTVPRLGASALASLCETLS